MPRHQQPFPDRVLAFHSRMHSGTEALGWQVVRWTPLLLLVLLLGGCVTAVPVQQANTGVGQMTAQRLSEIAGYELPASTPEALPEVSAVVITEGSRANVRSGPGLDFPIVAKANPGDTFTVVGKSQDGEWWQVCCVNGSDEAQGDTAWLASVVVEIDGDGDAVPVVTPLFDENLEATWRVDWQCGSERCDVKHCTATVHATAGESGNQQWLQVAHEAQWADDCFPPDSWVFQVDRYTGRERSGQFIDNFLYNYWLGMEPGPATNVFTLDDGRKVVVWCSGPHELEIAEGDGWDTVYQGETCHDVRTGTLVSLSYTKRWLFTGEYQGQQYERAYFGDYETLEQYLVDANYSLYYVD